MGAGQPTVVSISDVMRMGVATPTKQISFDFKLVTATGIDYCTRICTARVPSPAPLAPRFNNNNERKEY